MSNPNKRKGDTFELAVLHHVQTTGHPTATRTRAGYARDWGDIHLDTRASVILQCKNHARWALPEWLQQLTAQALAAGARHAALVIKRRGTGAIGRSYAVLELDDYLALLTDAVYSTDATREPAHHQPTNGAA